MRRVLLTSVVVWLSCVLSCGGRYRSGADETEDGAHRDPGDGFSKGGGSGGGAPGGGSSSSVPPLDDVCEAQRQSYVLRRQQLIDQFASFGCAVDSDCLSFYDQTPCDSSCRKLVTTGARRAVVDGMNRLAQEICSEDCSDYEKPACAVPATAVCVAGRCAPGDQ